MLILHLCTFSMYIISCEIHSIIHFHLQAELPVGGGPGRGGGARPYYRYYHLCVSVVKEQPEGGKGQEGHQKT